VASVNYSTGFLWGTAVANFPECSVDGCKKKTTWGECDLMSNMPDPGKFCREHFYDELRIVWEYEPDA
jgi:hypothetical protein